MQEPLIRGHVLEHTVRFCRLSYEHGEMARIDGELSVDVKAALDELTPAAWYPRRFQVELLNAVSTVRGKSDATYGDFLRCGTALAEPSNDFVRLLMQVMTPELFVKKLPRFWSRDHKGSGDFEVKALSDQRGAHICLRGVQDYDHGAILWMGFIQGVLKQIGASRLIVQQQGWSWSNPGPQEVAYEARWS